VRLRMRGQGIEIARPFSGIGWHMRTGTFTDLWEEPSGVESQTGVIASPDL